MPEDFVRKDIFDLNVNRVDHRFEMMEKLVNAAVERMEAIIEKNLAKHDAIASEMRIEVSEIKGDVRAINARLDTLQNKFSWNLAWVGIVIGIVLAVIQHVWR